MKSIRMIALSLVAAAVVLSAQSAWAQRRVPYYERRPPISPYLYLSRGSVGGFPSYYAWVLPEQSYRDFLQREQLQRERLNTVERQVLLRTDTAGAPSSGVRLRPNVGAGQPATVGGYMNYSHFYQYRAPTARR